ncbi:MAG: right-handed parallel beta-helix repeat-containing protein, partial [Polyangiaceae bacterium]|nr:right-handed parallel beta-helix repeat-containing protein [Polyangiaceae bacterium]
MRRLAPLALAVLLLSACGDDSEATSGSAATGSGGSSTGAGGGASTGTGGAGQGGGGGPPVVTSCGMAAPPPSLDCAMAEVICVDDDAGASQEAATPAEALAMATPGTTIVVHPGSYPGFEIDTSGSPGAPITVYANGDVVLDTPAPTGDGIRLQNVSHVRVQGFRIADVPQRCIAARGATPDAPMVDLAILDNQCARAGVEGFYLSEVSQSIVQGNTITESGASGDSRSHGIYLANAGSDGTVIACNVISRAGPAESNGIHMNGDLSIGGDGIISGVVVDSNVIFENAQNGLNLDGVQDSVFRNNLVYGNARNALRAYAIDAAEGPEGLVVVGNTLVAPSGAALKCSEDLGGHVVFDNVLISEDPDSASISIESASFLSAANAVVDRLSPDGDSSFLTLAEWQALGFDDGSFVATAAGLFVDPAAGDYSLLAGAPAVDAGLASFGGEDAPGV